MARKSNFIGTTETGHLSALGNAQQRDYNFVKNLLNRSDLIKYFAEPSVQENQEKIDWYSDTRGKIIEFQDLTPPQVQRAREELNWLIRELKSVASKAENQVDRQAIENLSVLPDTNSIKLVGDQITIINWAYRLHKRAKGDRQSSDFAGFVDTDTEADTVAETAAGVEVEKAIASNATGAIKTAKIDAEPAENNPTPITDDPKDLPLEADRGDENNSINTEPSMFSKASWILLSVFFLLLILTLILLKDACGVEGLPFLYFC